MQYTALMDEAAIPLARAIGLRVRQERRTREWSLDRLAQSAGVSRRMLVNVEQGSVNPSVGTLLRLSDALGVGLPALVQPPEPRPTRITRRGEGATLWSGEQGGRGVLVASSESPDALELWDWTLAPGDRRTSEAHTPGTRELLQVQEGSLTVEVDGAVHALDAGDALAFPGDLPHAYANPHDLPARFSLTVHEPGATPATRTEPM